MADRARALKRLSIDALGHRVPKTQHGLKAMISSRRSVIWVLCFVLEVLMMSTAARAGTLADTLISTFPGQLAEDGAGLAAVFARTVGTSFPVTGTSSAYVYRFDPGSDSFQRLNVPFGPVFSERAQTVGPQRLSLGVNYVLVQYDTINGKDLDALVTNDPRAPGDHLAICAGPLCEPVLGTARIDLEAQIVALSATYGVTTDLDVNLLVPIVRTFLRASTRFVGPDPRVPPDPSYFPFASANSASDASTGVGDILLRLKYVLDRSNLADVAAGLTVSLPTGDRSNFQGTGDTLIGAAVYASRTWAERVEPHVNLGFVMDAVRFERSQLRYSLGADLRLTEWLTLNTDFLGRSDVADPDSIDRPVFVQIERSDVLQFSSGFKVVLRPHVAVFCNALLPLNSDGARADLIPAFGVEAVF
jgi:outer membrane putative beta-barrel porin/alpha-amylase